MDKVRRLVLQQLGLMSVMASTADMVNAGASDLLAATLAGSDHNSIAIGPTYTRSRQGPLPKIMRQPAELMTSKLVLPYSAANALRSISYPTYRYAPGVWSEVGLTSDMGTTGERQEIGIVTDQIAIWLSGGSPNNMLAQAEAHGTSPVHFRHRNGVATLDGTGTMVDLINDPRVKFASCYDNPSAVRANPWFNRSGAKVKTDLAHYPSLNYVPFLATGDLYYLQECQDAATYALIWANPGYRQFEKALIQNDQTRGYAWALNLIASAFLATKEAESTRPLPAPLLPSSYWKRILDNNRAEFERRWVKNGDNNPLTGCHFAVDLTLDHVSPWQQDMLGAVMGWMIYTGQFPEWRSNYEWHMRQAIDRASGAARYPRSHAIVYYYRTAGVRDMVSLARVNGLIETAHGNYPPDTDTSYASYLRANLKIAVMNGMTQARDAYDYADAQAKRLRYIPMKWAV